MKVLTFKTFLLNIFESIVRETLKDFSTKLKKILKLNNIN